MNFFSELQFVIRSFAKYLVLVLLFAMVFFAVGIEKREVRGFVFPIPVIERRSITVRVFEAFSKDLLPPGVGLVAGSPLGAFTTEVEISLALALVATLPLFLYGLISYLVPALRTRERTIARIILIPSSILFVAGLFFGYRFIVPITFATLSEHAATLALQPYFFLDEFMSMSSILLLLTGAAFLVPVLLPVTAYFGIVPYSVWREYWRHFVFLTLLVTGIVTPDGTGITMTLLSIPLLVGYAIGMGISRSFEAKPQDVQQ